MKYARTSLLIIGVLVYGLLNWLERSEPLVLAQTSVQPTPTRTPTPIPSTPTATFTATSIPPTPTSTDTPTPIPSTLTPTSTPAPEQGIAALQVNLNNLLSNGNITQQGYEILSKRLRQALDKLNQGKTAAAKAQLSAFISQTKEGVVNGAMTQAVGDELIYSAQVIVNQLSN